MDTKFKLTKTCKNPECKQDIVHYKSSKRQYCDEICKNRANYLKRISEDYELIIMNKATRRNYKILKQLRSLNLGPILEQTLISHGFDFEAMHKDEFTTDKDGKIILANCIYDIYFLLNDENQLTFI